jgi:single-strand DNA-binding protein
MANLNKVMLIGRLTKDPEMVSFSSGGRVAKIRFAVNNRVKNQQSGQWEDKPVWLDVKAFNRETGRKLADLCEQYLKKGHQVYIEGHLVLEEWEKDGEKRSRLVIVMEDMQFLEPKTDGGASRSAPASAPARSAAPSSSTGQSHGGYDDEPGPPPNAGHQDEEIPF